MNIKNKTWLTRSIISMAVTSALLSNTVIAAENQDVDTTTITGESLSALDISIDQDALEKSQASNLKGIFKNEAEVTAGGGSAVSQKVYVRGLESTMLNVTIDGAKQTSNIFHHQGSLSIEPELLKKVEVQAGAGNALSGPGALGGGLRFITKDPEDLLDEEKQFGALLKGSYSTNANAYKTSISLYGKLNENWSGMATVVQTESDNYQDGDGNEVEYTDYNQQSGLIKIVGNFENNQRLSVSFDDRIDDGEKLLRANWGGGSSNAFEQESERQTSVIEYSINPSDNKWLALEMNAYHTDINLERPLYDDSGVVESYGFDIRNSTNFAKHALTYGFDYNNDQSSFIDSTGTGTDESDVYGLYLQADFQLAQAWSLSLGSRYDIQKTTDKDAEKFEDKGLSPNISVQFTPLENLQLNLSYAQAMRGIEVRESFLLYSGTRAYSNSPDLKAQSAENIEFSIDYQFAGLGLTAKAYQSTIDDVIAAESRVFTNVGELVTQGASFTINHNWESLNGSLMYSHNNIELNDEILDGFDTNLGTSTGDQINANISYQWSESLEFGWSANFATRLTDANEYFSEKAGYGVHDISAQWLPLDDDALKVTFSISNLFDKQYRDHATFGSYEEVYNGTTYAYEGDMSPGRDFKLAVAWAL